LTPLARFRYNKIYRILRLAGQSADGWRKQVDAWKAIGATSVIAEPRGAGLEFPQGHLDVLRRFKDAAV